MSIGLGRMVPCSGSGGYAAGSIGCVPLREDREDREDDLHLRGCARERGFGGEISSFARIPTLSSLSSLSSPKHQQAIEKMRELKAGLAQSILPEPASILPILPNAEQTETASSGHET